MYYEGRKKQQQKEQRTREASDQVLKLAEKDALEKHASVLSAQN